MRQKKSNKAPSHLSEESRKWWQSIIAEYELESHHLRLLRLAAEAWDRCQQARRRLQKHGMTYDDRFGQPKSRPEVAIERDSRLAFARLVRELGFDVADPDQSRPPRAGGQK